MAVARDKLELRGLSRNKMTELQRRARGLGITPEKCARQLIEDGLRISDDARTKTFVEIMEIDAQADEEEIDRLVDKAKARHHAITSKKKKR